jgi:hypothetical protein
MMSLEILPIPGTERNIVKNRFDLEIDLSWFPIVSTCLSIIGILTGALWIVEPVEKETHGITGKITFIPIFFYRMLTWLIILIILHSFSVLAFACFAFLNWLVLLFVQDQLEIDPVNHSLLSLIFPVYKLPSHEAESKISSRIFFWMVLTGNSVLLAFNSVLFCLYYYGIYNPWIKSGSTRILIQEEVYRNIYQLVLTLFVAATLPIVLSHFLPCKRYFFIAIASFFILPSISCIHVYICVKGNSGH